MTTKMRMGAALLVAILLSGCESPRNTWVRADRATFDALAPAHRRYVEADESLDDQQKQARYDMLRSWELRIETEEALIDGE